jgi:RNA polymerase sigma-70 factor (ECF subfamily)
MVAVIERGGLPTQAEFHEAISNRSDCWFAACLRITRSRELAEDAVQDALLSAWRKRHQFQGDSSLETWIHRIAVNSALQLIRKQRPAAFGPLDDAVDSPTADCDSPEADRANHDLGDSLAAAFRNLSEIERICFVLRHLEQWKVKEIAEEVGTNEGRVKQALFRGIRKLRVSMADLRSH